MMKMETLIIKTNLTIKCLKCRPWYKISLLRHNLIDWKIMLTIKSKKYGSNCKIMIKIYKELIKNSSLW
jgi:hypothetical protein